MDHISKPQNDICNANDLHVVLVSMDLEKAYEIVWRHRIIDILRKLEFEGNILEYIRNFVSDRKIQVRSGNHYSTETLIENGVP